MGSRCPAIESDTVTAASALQSVRRVIYCAADLDQSSAMENVTLAHAKEHLEELIERAARGEDVRISDPRVGTVRLTAVGGDPVASKRPKPIPGRWKDRLSDPPPDFFDPLSEEELKDWYGEDQ